MLDETAVSLRSGGQVVVEIRDPAIEAAVFERCPEAASCWPTRASKAREPPRRPSAVTYGTAPGAFDGSKERAENGRPILLRT